MEFYVIGDHDTVLGFSLAGIGGRDVKNSREGLAAIKEALGYPDIGILLITERLAEELRDEIDAVMITRRLPLIVEIPDIEGPVKGKATISDLVKSAIGIKI
jgi:V/A-type H+/Na+-transporting ATPase subunit F